MQRAPQHIWVTSSGPIIFPRSDESLGKEAVLSAEEFSGNIKELGITIIICGPERRNKNLAGIYAPNNDTCIIGTDKLASIAFPSGKKSAYLVKGVRYYEGELAVLWLGGESGIEKPDAYISRVTAVLEEILPRMSKDAVPLFISDECLVWALQNILESKKLSECIMESHPIGSIMRFPTKTLFPF